jgi:hypothetical protein
MRVETSPRAEKFIDGRGGTAYVWLEDRLRVSVEPPEGVPFEEVLADGYRLFIDSTMARPPKLEVSFRPLRGLCVSAPTSKMWFWRAVSKGEQVSEIHGD